MAIVLPRQYSIMLLESVDDVDTKVLPNRPRRCGQWAKNMPSQHREFTKTGQEISFTDTLDYGSTAFVGGHSAYLR